MAKNIFVEDKVHNDEFSSDGRDFYEIAEEEDIIKKFYRDFTEDDIDALNDLRELMKECYVQVPPFVIKRMINRNMVPESLGVFTKSGKFVRENLYKLRSVPLYNAVEDAVKKGIFFEVSDEGIQNDFSHYRLVLALEVDGETIFVKVAIPPKNGTVRIIDVWRKMGRIPYSPLPKQRAMFLRGRDWDISYIVDELIEKSEDSIEA